MEKILYLNSNNFATILNRADNLSELVNSMCCDCLNEGKVATEMIIREQHNKATLEEAKKNVEVASVALEVAKNKFGNFYNYSLISDEEFKYNSVRIGDNIKSYFDENGKNHHFITEYNASCLSDNQKVENVLNFTKTEMQRIKGEGKYEGSPLGDYEIGNGGLKEVELDAGILQKIRNCDIKGADDNYIFRDFLVLDGNGTALKCSNYGFIENGIIANFAGMVEGNSQTAIRNLIDFSEFQRKKIGKGNAAKLKLLSRVSGMKDLDEENRQYTDQITKPAHYAKSIHSGIEKGVGTTTRFGATIFNTKKGVAIFAKNLEIAKLEKLLKNKNLSDKAREELLRRLAKSKEDAEKVLSILKGRASKVGKAGKVAHYVWNPHEAVAHGVKKGAMFGAKKIASTNTFKKAANSAVTRGARGVYDKMSKPFRVLSNSRKKFLEFTSNLVFNNRLSKILRNIFVWAVRIAKIAVVPLAIIIIIVFAVGLMGEAGTSSTRALVVMPLANEEDFVNYQNWYNSFDDAFLKSLEGYVQNKTIGTNLKGEHIFYGINGMNNEEGMKNNDYNNGLYYKYITDAIHEGRSSNIEDLIAMMAIIMSQQQSDYKEESKEVLRWLYNLSHTYTYQESPLFACDSACHKIEYHCYDHYHKYEDTDIRYNPLHAVKKSGNEYEIKKADKKCEVCSQFFDESKDIPEYKGGGHSEDCVIVSSETKLPEEYYGCESVGECYHGKEGYIGRGRRCSYCSNYNEVYDCQHVCGSACDDG